jgi:ribonuclease BN (tRNA processing enzyme)
MRAILALLSASAVLPINAAAATCTGHGVELQVLGSGGPELEDKRASTSYLVWQDGAARILVDSGGGNSSDVTALATQVLHGGVPALAWRVNVGGRSIVFSGDTNGANGNLELLARGADLFIAHNAVPEGESGAAVQLHMPPSVIARIASTAGVKQIVLSHRMLRTLGRESETRAVIAKLYAGPVVFADDLDCFD